MKVATYVTAIYDFRAGGIAQATFSFDSPLARVGVLEISGSEATLATPDPNKFTGDIKVIKSGEEDWQTVAGHRGGGRPRNRRRRHGQGAATGSAAPGHRQLGLHVLDAMLATAESIENRTFVDVHSGFEPVEALPEDWDPTVRVV